eukprot:1667638-Pyramimonas_sp.AAC.1
MWYCGWHDCRKAHHRWPPGTFCDLSSFATHKTQPDQHFCTVQGVKIQRVRYPVHQTNIIVRTIAVMFLYTCIDDAQQAKTAGVADLDGKNLIVV